MQSLESAKTSVKAEASRYANTPTIDSRRRHAGTGPSACRRFLTSVAPLALLLGLANAPQAWAQSVNMTGDTNPAAAGSVNASTDLQIGVTGTGALTATGGGTVSSSHGFIGKNAGSDGTISVSGTDGNGNASTWTTVSEIHVGDSGTGALNITGGGVVNAGDTSYIGYATGSQGTASVSGDDGHGRASTWSNSGDLVVGQDGDGTLSIGSGGKVTNANGYVGAEFVATGHHSDVTVSGTGSTWTNTGQLNIGDNGAGTLTIQDGGVVNAQQSATLGLNSAGLDAAHATGVGTVLVTGRDIFGHASTWN